MQSYEELVKMLLPAAKSADLAATWAQYLVQLKGCSLHSAAVQTQDEAGWHAARATGIGGSDIAAIMGESSWKSPYDIWMAKTGQIASSGAEMPQSEAARWGNVLEDAIAYEWARREGKQIVKIPVSLKSDTHEYMHANIDGFVLSDDGRTVEGILEIKTTSAYNNDAWEIGPLPYYYICQATWYTMITGLPAFDIVCLVGGQKLYSYHIPKDPELCERMTKAAEEFWNVNVKELKEPKATAVDIARMQAEEVSTAPDEEPLIDNSDETNNIVVAYIELRDKISALEKIKKQLSASIWQCLHKKPAMLTQANTVTVSQTVRRKCDLDALQRDFPEAYEATVTQSTEQRLNVK